MRKLRWQWSTLSSVCESWKLESFAENTSNSSQIRSKGWSALRAERHRFWGRYVAPLSDWIIWFKVIRIARFVQGLGCPGDTHSWFCLSSILTYHEPISIPKFVQCFLKCICVFALEEEHTRRSAINTWRTSFSYHAGGQCQELETDPKMQGEMQGWILMWLNVGLSPSPWYQKVN